jgi:TPP-dependent indolepyruvate ferredoxin oxidoreductase alpha subunit
LQLVEFTIFSNQKSLIHLNEQRLNTFWQHKVFNKLFGLHYKIVYKKGIDNGVAYALFRKVDTKEAQVLSLSTVVPAQLELIQSSCENVTP